VPQRSHTALSAPSNSFLVTVTETQLLQVGQNGALPQGMQSLRYSRP